LRIGNNFSWGVMQTFGVSPTVGCGLVLPMNYNNVDVTLDQYYGIGFKYNVVASECTHIGALYGYGVVVGLMQIAANHSLRVDYEYVYAAIYPYVAAKNNVGSGSVGDWCNITIGFLDIEDANWLAWMDPNDISRGNVTYYYDYNGPTDIWQTQYQHVFGGTRVMFNDAYRGQLDHLSVGRSTTNFQFNVTATNTLVLRDANSNSVAILSTNGAILAGTIVGNGAGLINLFDAPNNIVFAPLANAIWATNKTVVYSTNNYVDLVAGTWRIFAFVAGTNNSGTAGVQVGISTTNGATVYATGAIRKTDIWTATATIENGNPTSTSSTVPSNVRDTFGGVGPWGSGTELARGEGNQKYVSTTSDGVLTLTNSVRLFWCVQQYWNGTVDAANQAALLTNSVAIFQRIR